MKMPLPDLNLDPTATEYPGHVLVRFELDVDDGWPPVPVEDIWAAETDGDGVRLANIPLFARDVAFGDILAVDEGKERAFRSVTARSGHSTVRVIAADQHDVEELAQHLIDKGCSVAMSFIPAMFAVDVPPGVKYRPLARWLAGRENDGVLDYEEGYIAPGQG